MKVENQHRAKFKQIGFNQYRQKVVYCFKSAMGVIEAFDNHNKAFKVFGTLKEMKEYYEKKYGNKKEWFWNALNPKKRIKKHGK